MTAIIDARGNLVAALPAFETGVLTGEISAYRGTTPFSRWGNLGFLSLTLLLLLAARPGRRI
jgi:apolipoprotein N-acyltransferase